MDAHETYLMGKMRAWPPLSATLKAELIDVVLNDPVIELKAENNSAVYTMEPMSFKLRALLRSGCLMFIPTPSLKSKYRLELTPSGWVQALCADDRVILNSGKVLSRLKHRLPNLASCWPTLSRASMEASLRILASSVRFAVSSRDWHEAPGWMPFERYYVFATFRALDISQDERERILGAVRRKPSIKEFYLRAIQDLFERHDFLAREADNVTRILQLHTTSVHD